MQPIITCKACGAQISIDEAILQGFKDEAMKELKLDHQKELKDIEAKVSQQLQEEFSKQSNLEIKNLKNELDERKLKEAEYREQELQLRKEKRLLIEEKKELDLEVQRKLDEELTKYEQKTMAKAAEAYRLKEASQNKIIDNLRQDLADATRRAEQGSQQLQGEILELDLEQSLKQNYPSDLIEPVPKGIKGADIKHVVKSPRGLECGIIIWELKRTKSWSDSWIAKLKSDMRAVNGNIPVIISECLPKSVTDLALYEGVWVASPTLALALAALLRKDLLDVGLQKALSKNRGNKADVLYEYITSHAFTQQVEALIETYTDMKDHINRERAYFERSWATRETQANRILLSTANIYGNMEGSIGHNSMPQIKGLDLLEPGDELN